jgi:hypothetical protein
MRFVAGLLTTLCLGGVACAAAIPSDVLACVHAAGASYAINDKLDPFYVRGDFDGDGKPDNAVVVNRRREQGILVCRSGAASPLVLGAGVAFNDMKNLDFTAWRIHSKNQRVARGVGQGRPPVLTGDALVLEWESASAIVYWNGKRFVWYQQGD